MYHRHKLLDIISVKIRLCQITWFKTFFKIYVFAQLVKREGYLFPRDPEFHYNEI
jgi:hypothetical protein